MKTIVYILISSLLIGLTGCMTGTNTVETQFIDDHGYPKGTNTVNVKFRIHLDPKSGLSTVTVLSHESPVLTEGAKEFVERQTMPHPGKSTLMVDEKGKPWNDGKDLIFTYTFKFGGPLQQIEAEALGQLMKADNNLSEDQLKALAEKSVPEASNQTRQDNTSGMLLGWLAAYNETRLDLYGKVIDQDGHPIAGVEVAGSLDIDSPGSDRIYKTKTDADGLFQITGLHGNELGADVSKPGYEMDYRRGLFEPSGKSTPTNRVVYTMWKLRGPEPMKYAQIQSSVPCDGTPEHFDLLSSKMNNTVADVHPSSGDFTVKLTRDPLIVDRRKPFNWSVILSITNGGLLEFTNQPYPYEAPETGYQSVVTMDFPTNAPQWQYEINKNYFFKSGDGRIYGRMTVHLRADRPQPPTYFDAEIYANPNGSRNLEFDPAKEIFR